MSASAVRGRLAPTPSGRMHLGNALSALLAWLQARSQGGAVVLRLEDLDRPRCKPAYAEALLHDLRWLGLDWDEGPDKGGPYGPYAQSGRQARYEEAIRLLTGQGRLYPCYCSRAELAGLASAPHGLASDGPAYPGLCRGLTPEERAARAAVKTPAWRFALPERPVAFVDGVAGPQTYPPGAGGDFVVQRADGIIGYQLAVVVDDIAMDITHVFRGWDLLDSTPRQLLLHEALAPDRRPPAYAHGPLVLGPDGERLAKRHGAVGLDAVRDAGVRPEAVVGYLAWLAGVLETDRPEPATAAELAASGRFETGRIARGGVRLQEDWMERLRRMR